MEEGHRVIVVLEEQHNPFELWVLGALFLSSFLFLLGVAPPPSSVEATVTSDFWRWLWYVQIFSGTVFTLLFEFVLQKFPIARKTLQIAGYYQVAAGCFTYAGAVFFYAGPAGTGSGSLIGFVGIAALFRVYQLSQQIKVIRKRFEELSQ